jgi:2-amino-4-hydroxy-6-hydroxymethyldihydropteridine diphosphokinase
LATAFLGLGSNLGHREANIREALYRLSERHEIRPIKVSSLYETGPIGCTDQPDFINAVAEIETDLLPLDLLRAVLDIEKEMGRVRTVQWGPRVIDIDVLLYDNTVMDVPGLTLPHPRMLHRAFVIAPLAEIAPDLELPGGFRPAELLDKLKDQRVEKIAEVE